MKGKKGKEERKKKTEKKSRVDVGIEPATSQSAAVTTTEGLIANCTYVRTYYISQISILMT